MSRSMARLKRSGTSPSDTIVVKIGLYMIGSAGGGPSSEGFVPAYAEVLEIFSENIDNNGRNSHRSGYARPIRPEETPSPTHAA